MAFVHRCQEQSIDDSIGCRQPATESQWRIYKTGEPPLVFIVCADHVECCRGYDAASEERRDADTYADGGNLYLPIVQPVVGSEQAIAMEVALHTACRLLRICKGDDEAEQTLTLLRQTQAEARGRRRTRRVLGLEASGGVRKRSYDDDHQTRRASRRCHARTEPPMILAIDPGDQLSAFVVYDGKRPVDHGKLGNEELIDRLYAAHVNDSVRCSHLAIEMAESFGAKVWNQVFLATLWAGRFVEAFGGPYTLMSRQKTKLYVTGNPRAKDAQVRACLIDRYGGKDVALGTKAAPGVLRGLTADRWAALALAVAYSEGQGMSVVHQQQQKQEAA